MERQKLGRAGAKAWSNTAKPGLGWGQHPWGYRGEQNSSGALTGVQEPAQLPLAAHLTAWDSAGPWVGSGREGALAKAGRAPGFLSGKG